jgi:hypothetical protein
VSDLLLEPREISFMLSVYFDILKDRCLVAIK